MIKNAFKMVALAATLLSTTSCDVLQAVLNSQTQTQGGATTAGKLSSGEVGAGLKEALEKGALFAGSKASQENGFFKNPLLFIPFPPEVKKVESTLRSLGMNKLADDFVLSLNRGAEKAAREAAPIFIGAIRKMSISDAFSVLRGGQNAATVYLKTNTQAELLSKFRPVIEKSLAEVSATKYWADVSAVYNKVPFVTPVNTDLTGYVTDKAVSGLFTLVEEQERKIRENPIERTSELLKRVFAQ